MPTDSPRQGGAGVLGSGLVSFHSRQNTRTTIMQINNSRELSKNTQFSLMERIGVHPYEMAGLSKNFENPADYWKTVVGCYDYDNFPFSSIYRDMLARSDRKIVLNSTFFEFMGQAINHFNFDFPAKSEIDWKKFTNIRKLGVESPFNADLCAKDVRNFLKLDDGPISSVFDLIQDLGIPVCFVSMKREKDYLNPSFNAIGSSLPKPFILIGYDNKSTQDFIRMVMAYSLGWFLLDRGSIPSLSEDVFMLNSNEVVKEIEPWRFMKDYSARNKRAKIFASYFLAPPSGVLKLIGDNQKKDFTLENIRKISSHFGIPHICSLKTLGSLCSIDKETEFGMQKRINGIANNLRFADNCPREERDLNKAVNMWKNVFAI